MPLKHGLLGLLNYGGMTGYELDKAFNASLGFFWQGQMSQIYRELNAMERSGWLTSERVIQDERPNKKVYRITDSGKTELQNWLAAPEADISDAMRIRSAFLMRVFFAGETDVEQAVKLLAAFRDECLKALADIDAVATFVYLMTYKIPYLWVFLPFVYKPWHCPVKYEFWRGFYVCGNFVFNI